MTHTVQEAMAAARPSPRFSRAPGKSLAVDVRVDGNAETYLAVPLNKGLGPGREALFSLTQVGLAIHAQELSSPYDSLGDKRFVIGVELDNAGDQRHKAVLR